MLSSSAGSINVRGILCTRIDITHHPNDLLTLKVIMLNKEIFPPEADMTYESFFDKAKQ